jgi:hypothetical protein
VLHFQPERRRVVVKTLFLDESGDHNLEVIVLGKEPKEDFRIVEQKFRRNPHGSYQGWELVVLPKEEGQPPLRSDQPQVKQNP